MRYSISTKILAIFGLSIVFSLSLTGCGANGDGFLEPGIQGTDTVPPAVLSTTPGTNASGVFINTALSVNFSEYVNQSTVSPSAILLKDANDNQVSGTVVCNGMSATFTPISFLSPTTTYTATITTAITDQSGNHMANDYTWSFTTNSRTDFTAPTILSSSPGSNETDVTLSSSVTVTFSEDMDPSTINDGTFYLQDMWHNPVPAVISSGGTAATLRPATGLKMRTSYTACITTGAADLAGNHLQNDRCWNFTAIYNSGFFKPATAIRIGSMPEATVIGDVNGDGENDVVLITSFYFDPANDYKLFVFLQNDVGNLATAVTYTTTGTYGGRPSSVAIGDINNDGKNEVVIGNDRQNIEVFMQNGSGDLVSGAVYTTVNSGKVKIADLNHDGLLDIVGVGWATNTVDVFLQNANGMLDSGVTYTVTNGGYEDLAVSDVSNDGLTDIIVMSGQSYAYPNLGVLIQKPDGTFNQPVYYSVGQNILTRGVAVGDVNGDLLNDVVVTYFDTNAYDYNIGVFTQNNSGDLNSVVSYPSYNMPDTIEVADVSGDGKKDVIVAHGGWSTLGIYVQAQDGTLLPEEYYGLPFSDYYGLAMGDFNGDGLKDVAIADFNELVLLYHK